MEGPNKEVKIREKETMTEEAVVSNMDGGWGNEELGKA